MAFFEISAGAYVLANGEAKLPPPGIGGAPGAPRVTRIGCSMHNSGGEAFSIG